MKMRVLFVDDEPGILAGLRRMLRPFRSEWHMEFSESGQDALDRMTISPFDVIVTDMRMPGMDGNQLLSKAVEMCPDAVRIILSGEADGESILKSVGLAHQYLSKPCDSKILKATIARTCALKAMLEQESLRRLVSGVMTIPSPPRAFSQLVDELHSKDPSIQRVGQMVTQDVGMTAKLMQLVNSSFFGTPRRIKTPSHAAAILGLSRLKPLVLTAGVFSMFDGGDVESHVVDAILEHSMVVSKIANQIAKSHDEPDDLAEASTLAGMLHNVGQLLFLSHLKEPFNEAFEMAREEGIALWKAQVKVCGAGQSDVGAYLLRLWGLPDTIVEAVAFHHQPSRCRSNLFSPLTAVHVANALVSEDVEPKSVANHVDIDMEYVERVGVDHRLLEWQTTVEDVLNENTEVTQSR